MYNMDIDKRPSKPVISSQLSAKDAMDRWVKENDYHEITDGDGTSWSVEVIATEIPDPVNPYGLLWELAIQMKADLSVEHLIKIGALDPEKDQRLLGLIEGGVIPTFIRPRVFTAPSDDEVRRKVVAVLPELRKELQSAKLLETKRKLVGRWVDDSKQFG